MALTLAKPLPKGCEYLADVCEEVAPKFGISPYLLLGFLYAESNFGLALKPVGPNGSGDFIARLADKDTNEKMAKNPLPGVVRKTLPDGIKARKIAGPCDAWVPTTTGWGCGLFQIDYEAHYEFCKSGDWADAKKACSYACGILVSGRKFLKGKHPEMKAHELDRAVIASYNAGAGRVHKFLVDKKDIDGCTFHPGYIDKICKKADELAGASGAWMTPTA
jgi:hypothetical protein